MPIILAIHQWDGANDENFREVKSRVLESKAPEAHDVVMCRSYTIDR